MAEVARQAREAPTLSTGKKKSKKSKYPHQFNNKEGLGLQSAPPWMEYPVTGPTGAYDSGPPGPARLFCNSNATPNSRQVVDFGYHDDRKPNSTGGNHAQFTLANLRRKRTSETSNLSPIYSSPSPYPPSPNAAAAGDLGLGLYPDSLIGTTTNAYSVPSSSTATAGAYGDPTSPPTDLFTGNGSAYSALSGLTAAPPSEYESSYISNTHPVYGEDMTQALPLDYGQLGPFDGSLSPPYYPSSPPYSPPYYEPGYQPF